MTEADNDSDNWLTCNDAGALGGILAGLAFHGWPEVTARKVALCEVACARLVAHLFTSDIQARTVELAEAAADAPAYPLSTYPAIKAYFEEYGPAPDFLPLPPKDPLTNAAWEVAANLAYPERPGPQVRQVGGRAATLAAIAAGDPETNPENQPQVMLIREIFGNPFRPVAADRAWLSPTVVALAAAIYHQRAFDRMPVLADALEEAGCANADVLLHCRQPGEHVRGCWVVDVVLGKE